MGPWLVGERVSLTAGKGWFSGPSAQQRLRGLGMTWEGMQFSHRCHKPSPEDLGHLQDVALWASFSNLAVRPLPYLCDLRGWWTFMDSYLPWTWRKHPVSASPRDLDWTATWDPLADWKIGSHKRMKLLGLPFFVFWMDKAQQVLKSSQRAQMWKCWSSNKST